MRRHAYLTVTALSAACGRVIEIAAGRMLAPYLGMSLYTWTAIIAVVLAGFSAGHWIGGRLAERDTASAHMSVVWSLVAAGLTSAAALVLIRLVAGPVISLEFAPVTTILLLTTLLFFLPSLFVGIPSPVLTKLAIDLAPDQLPRTLGAFYAAGALGSIFGTLAAGYVFISWLGTIWTFLLVALLYGAMAIVLLMIGHGAPGDVAAPRGRSSRPVMVLFAAGVAIIVLLIAGRSLGAFLNPCTKESTYYCIRLIDEAAAPGNPARTLVLDHLVHGTNVARSPRRFRVPYVELQDALVRIHSGRDTPFRAFFVGGGAYTLPRAWLSVRPDVELTVAEIDPEVTRLARERMWLEGRAPALDVRHVDARLELATRPSGFYDVVVGDAFQDIAVPQHLVTREFFELVVDRLKADGVMVMNVVDRFDRPRLVVSLLATLEGLFPVVEVWRFNESGARTTFVIAGLRQATPYRRIPSQNTAGLVFDRLPRARLTESSERAGALVLTDDYAPVDRLIGVD